MERLIERLVSESRQVLATSRASCRLAKNRIAHSRQQLSHSGDVVVRSASQITAARAALRHREQRPG